MKPLIEINYLDIYTKKITSLKNELLHVQDVADVTANIDQVQRLSDALAGLKEVVDNLPLA